MTDEEKLAAVREVLKRWREDGSDESFEHQFYYATQIEKAMGEYDDRG